MISLAQVPGDARGIQQISLKMFYLGKSSAKYGPVQKRSSNLVQPFGQLAIANKYKYDRFQNNIVFEITTFFKKKDFLF